MDHFKITEPTCISFSGGRTSAYMLYRILESNNGLPDDAIVCFANTGKEMEETLEFVRDCSVNWNVPISWVEYSENEESKNRFKVVDFETASRNGEPFAAMIKRKTFLPNPVTRFCTVELKIRVIHKYLKSLGIKHNETMDWVGIRYDEPRRAAKIGIDRTPLYASRITKEIVGEFWKDNDFDLALPNFNGTTYHGNCDLCFLKPAHQIQSLIAEIPGRADWWMDIETSIERSGKFIGDGARFRKDRPSYAQMKKYAIDQSDIFDLGEESISCFCGD